MKISKAIEQLRLIKERWGDIEILLDCTHCGKSTTPDKLEIEVVVRGKEK